MGAYRFLKLDPLPGYVQDRLNFYTNPVNVSELAVWTKITSGAGPVDADGGLTIVSNPNIPTFGNNSIHGTLDANAPIGYQNFSGEPVNSVSAVTNSNSGYKPRPIIEGISVTTGTRGLTRKAEFDIKCYTIEQTELISQYFLEPGFTVVLEWGWNVMQSYQQIASSPEELADIANFDKLDRKREESEGTYEAFSGVVVGGGISQNDAAYTVSVELNGLGQVFSYIQSHNNSSVSDTNEADEDEEQLTVITEIGSSDIAINDDIYNDQKESFAFMFNSLPEKWKTTRVQNLINNEEISNSNNFINFIPQIREEMAQQTDAAGIFEALKRNAGTVQTEGGRIDVPSGEGIVDTERYIRFGVLMDILYTGAYNLDLGVKFRGENNNIPIRINTTNVPINAFKKMFSTDGSKLYIPNTQLPDFGLIESFNSTNPQLYYKAFYETVDQKYNPGFETGRYLSFPQPVSFRTYLNTATRDTGDLSSDDFNAAAYEYGFLEDLFINFDFAMSVIERKGLTMKDIILELLNGMSAAVDNLWNFQLIETETGGISVVDYAFSEFNEKKDTPVPELVSNGTRSPFTSYQFNIDIPGAMMNSIIGRRLTEDNVEFQTDRSRLPNRLFGDGVEFEDKLAINNGIEKRRSIKPSSTKAGDNDSESLILQNFERFQKNATIIPIVTTYQSGLFDKGKAAKTSLSPETLNALDYALVGAFQDSNLLKLIRLEDSGTTVEKGLSSLLPISTNFTTYGIGGLRNGLTYRIIDLPQKFSQRGLFQITEASHEISGMTWTTTVKGEFRQTSESGND